MHFKIINVTPREAAEYLEKNPNNRKLTRRRINRYAAMMRSGRWKENGDTVRIGKSGRLLDGQHRLSAVLECGFPMKLAFAFDVDDDAFDTIDTGANRSAGDVLGIEAYANPVVCGGVAGVLWRMLHGQRPGAAMPPTYVRETVRRWPEIVDAAARAQSSDARYIMTPTTLGAAILYLESVAGKPALAKAFVDGMTTGAGLVSGDPVLALRNRLQNMRSHGKPHTRQVWEMTCRALSALERGEQLHRIQAATPGSLISSPDLFADHTSDWTSLRKLTDLLPAFEPARWSEETKLAAE